MYNTERTIKAQPPSPKHCSQFKTFSHTERLGLDGPNTAVRFGRTMLGLEVTQDGMGLTVFVSGSQE